MKKVCALILTVVLLVCFIASTGCKKEDKKTIKIGLIVPKTGPASQYGTAVEYSVKLAFEEVNKNGGIDGKTVELITYDSKADTTESINAFNKLVDTDGVVAVIGPIMSSTSLAVAPIAQEKKIPMITPTATNTAITQDYEYVFRACYLVDYQGKAIAKYTKDKLKYDSVAIVYNMDDNYSTLLAESFKATFEADGGTVTNFEAYTNKDSDFKLILTNIKENSPDAIFIPDYTNTVGPIAKQSKSLGITSTLIGGDGWDDIQKIYSDVVEGAYFANHYTSADTSEIVQNFISAYKTKYEGQTPNSFGALGYDAANILINAIDAANSTSSDKIIAQLKLTDMVGVTGKIVFDEFGNPLQKEISMNKVEAGKLKLDSKITYTE